MRLYMVKNSEYLCKCNVHRDTRCDELKSQVSFQKEVLCPFLSHERNKFEGILLYAPIWPTFIANHPIFAVCWILF